MVQVCPQVLANGSCDTPSCKFNHNVRVCEPCRVFFSSDAMYRSHMKGKRHQKRVSGAFTFFRCSLCQTNITGTRAWDQHLAGRPHQTNAAHQNVAPQVQPEEGVSGPGSVFCGICDRPVLKRHWPGHAQTAAHCTKEQYAAYRAALEETEKDKNGVSIAGNMDFGIVELSDARDGVRARATVTTNVPASRIELVDVKLASAHGATAASPSPFSVAAEGANVTLTVARPITFAVSFSRAYGGRFDDRLELVFEDIQLRKRFAISRSLRAIVGSRADHELLKPTAPYVPRTRQTRQPETDVVEGVLPAALKAIPWKVPLPHAKISAQVSSMLARGSAADVIKNVRRVLLPRELNSDSYARHFKNLLWFEEFRMEHDLGTYDITDAKLERNSFFHFLTVHGLAEKRPSVLVGDRILVQKHGAPQGHWYEGGVHFVRKEEVGLRFHSSFQGWTPAQRYNVHFKLNRYPLRRQHQALDTAFSADRILFPLERHIPDRSYRLQATARLNVFNPLIAQNAPQLQAVISITHQKPGAVPFIVFGPPGTGKTVTIVEAIRQILVHNPAARILACAPSNSAADLIASRLTALSTDELFRFYAPSRHKEDVPDGLRPYTVATPEGHFSVPVLARMKRFRVVVTTCVSASITHGLGIPRGHFSHIFVDEAGQATEPEIMIAAKTMADNNTNVVLSGDPKQLGPIIRSNVARELGLETSYLERLMNRDLYDEKTGYGSSVVKLVKNFRSHSAILKFPNERFYKGDLLPCGDPKVINSYLGSSHLASPKFPIVFHAVSGKDDREASSPSFFNIDESTQVRRYVDALKQDRRVRITDHDIGVVTPYHAQCRKIRMALKANADSVKVGSVEEFQGQERRVIIISTVRSSRDFVQYDLKHTLGFVANPRRFNVAVTRAQSLLIVIGDPSVLSLDPLWRSFLNYVYLNGGWKGSPIDWDPRGPVDEAGTYDRGFRERALVDMNDFTRRMEALTLAGVGSLEEGGEDADANVDRPWRDAE